MISPDTLIDIAMYSVASLLIVIVWGAIIGALVLLFIVVKDLVRYRHEKLKKAIQELHDERLKTMDVEGE